MPFVLDVFTHLFSWDQDPQRQEKIINARLEAEFDGIDTGLSTVSADLSTLEAAAVRSTNTFGTDNRLIKSDGTSRNVEVTGITVADTTNNVSGVGTLSTAGNISATLSQNAQTIIGVTNQDAGGSAAAVLRAIAGSSTFEAVANSNNSAGFTYNGSGGMSFNATAGLAQFTTSVFTERLRLANSQNVYVPGATTTASAANAFLNSGSTPANELLRSTSSVRYKRDIENVDRERSDAILGLRPIWYRSSIPNDNQEWSWYGLAAEEVAVIDPRLVHWGYADEDREEVIEDGPIPIKTMQPRAGAQLIPDGVQYERVAVLLLDVVKRLSARVDELEQALTKAP